MPTTYTGNPAAITPRQAVQVSNPNDLEDATAASNKDAVEELSDIVKFVMDNAALMSPGASPTVDNTRVVMLNGPTDEFNPSLACEKVPTTRKYVTGWRAGSAPATWVRFYSAVYNAVEITINAYWTGTQWVPDTNTLPSSRFVLESGQLSFMTLAAGPANWSDATFTARVVKLDPTEPVATVALTNTITAKSFSKAWGFFSLGNSGVSSPDGTNLITAAPENALNVTSAIAKTAGYVEVTLAAGVSAAARTSLVSHFTTSATGQPGLTGHRWMSATVFRLYLFETNPAGFGHVAVDPTAPGDARSMSLSFTLHAEQ